MYGFAEGTETELLEALPRPVAGETLSIRNSTVRTAVLVFLGRMHVA